jgi:hypothetical protein
MIYKHLGLSRDAGNVYISWGLRDLVLSGLSVSYLSVSDKVSMLIECKAWRLILLVSVLPRRGTDKRMEAQVDENETNYHER